MDRKVCVITGANSGIGKQAAIQLTEKGYHVVMACRSRERGEAALKEIQSLNPDASVVLLIVDLSLRESILNFVKSFKEIHERLDVLIHNAALFDITQKGRKETSEGIETVWAANHLGPVLITELLLKELQAVENGRVLTVSSKGLLAKPFLKVDLKDPEFKNRRFTVPNAYYQSKRAQVMYTYALADRLKGTGVTVNSIRVPAVKVDISRHPELSSFMKWVYSKKAAQSIEPAKMAETYTFLAVSHEVREVSGRYFDENNRQVESGKYSRDPEQIREVMELTARYVPELKAGR